MSNLERFTETQLPLIKAFYSSLTKENISQQEYEHAQTVWREVNIQNLKGYHDLYLETDVLLLADVFETFRNLCLNYYQIDPLHTYSIPGFTWEACLKKTRVQLELLQDVNKHLFIESAIRGGVSMVSTKYASNNNYTGDYYDPNKESVYLIYLDCNSLYSAAMCEPLPIGGFNWVSEEMYKSETRNDYGFILEVDLENPKHLHDLHNDYPLPRKKRMGNKFTL